MESAPEPGLVERRRRQRKESAIRFLRGERFVQGATELAPTGDPAAQAPRFQYAHHDDHAVFRAAQELFLHGVYEVAPEVLEDLASEPFALVRQLAEARGASILNAPDLAGDPRVLGAVRAWGQRWHLTDGWLEEQAFMTLVAWLGSELSHAGREWWMLSFFLRGWPADDPVGTISVDGLGPFFWDPFHEVRTDARDRVLAAVAAHVERRLDEIDAAAREQGAVPAPAKRSDDDHFVWLARFQVLDESFGMIARAAHRDRQTVADAVRGAAEQIGLTLRPTGRGGRPRARHGRARTVRVERPAP